MKYFKGKVIIMFVVTVIRKKAIIRLFDYSIIRSFDKKPPLSFLLNHSPASQLQRSCPISFQIPSKTSLQDQSYPTYLDLTLNPISSRLSYMERKTIPSIGLAFSPPSNLPFSPPFASFLESCPPSQSEARHPGARVCP